jgi:hypothetical protein
VRAQVCAAAVTAGLLVASSQLAWAQPEPEVAPPEVAPPEVAPPEEVPPEAAEPEVAAPALAEPEPPKDEQKKDEKKKDKKDKKQDEPRAITFGARFFVRDTFDDVTWANEMQISSVRAGFALRDDARGLAAEVEVEFADREAEVKDTWLRYDATKSVRIIAGNFKRPIGALALASRWALPVPERGVISDLEVPTDFTRPDQLPLGGRDLGVAVRLDPKWAPLDGKLTLGVFQSVIHRQITEGTFPGDRTSIGWDEGFPEDVHARVAVEPVPGIEIAASGAWFAMLEEAGDRETFEHGLLGAIDTTIEAGPLRVWAEAFLGSSPIHFGTALLARGRFVAARALAAYAIAVPYGNLYSIEPFAMVQGADLSSGVDEDRAFGASGGLAFHYAGDWRVTLSAEHTALQSQLGTDIIRFYIQLGARFES